MFKLDNLLAVLTTENTKNVKKLYDTLVQFFFPVPVRLFSHGGQNGKIERKNKNDSCVSLAISRLKMYFNIHVSFVSFLYFCRSKNSKADRAKMFCG